MAESENEPKGQHFLLSPECRTLTVMDLAKLREETACGWFKKMRWPQTDGEPYCPKCGTLRCHAMSRGRFKCSDRAKMAGDPGSAIGGGQGGAKDNLDGHPGSADPQMRW